MSMFTVFRPRETTGALVNTCRRNKLLRYMRPYCTWQMLLIDKELDRFLPCSGISNIGTMTAHHEKQTTSVSAAPFESTATANNNKAQLRRYKIGYFLSWLGIGPAFAAFGTYVAFQIQTIAYIVGHEPGAPSGSTYIFG
jgi:hypothetical protein